MFFAIFSKFFRIFDGFNVFFYRRSRILTGAAWFAEQKPKEKRGAEEARDDADRQNAWEKDDSRERMTAGEEERAEEERRRD